MIARIWAADVDTTDIETYETFARDVSVPMFKGQRGYRGVLMVRNGSACQVITLWSDRDAVAALETSPSYRGTVASIQALGILSNLRPVQLFELHELETVCL